MKIVKVGNVPGNAYQWTPVRGCGKVPHCWYCHAKGGKDSFKPTFHEDEFAALDRRFPQRGGPPWSRYMTVCETAELFGPGIDPGWLERIMEKVRKRTDWQFLFLSKFPHRMVDIEWPENAWIGATVTEQKYVKPTEDAFEKIDARVKFVSVAPMLEPVVFNRPHLFDWYIVGGLTGSFPFIPAREWVDSVIAQARAVQAAVMMTSTAIAVQEPEDLIREMPEI